MRLELTHVSISWRNLISFLVYRKPAKVEFGNISLKSRAYPNELLISDKSDVNSKRHHEKSKLRSVLERIENTVEEIVVKKLKITIELFTSEFDQTETKWELSCHNLMFNVEQSQSGC